MSDEEENSNETGNKNDSLEEESEATLLVNSTTYKNVFPADIRKLMSVPEKKKSSNKIKKQKKSLQTKLNFYEKKILKMN